MKALPVLLACVVGAIACTPDVDVPPARNVVLISVDTLRADRLGCYGHAKPTTPALDRLAKRGVLFENAISTASWTVPAHASMLTGLYVKAHGVNAVGERLPAEIPTLAEMLAASGRTTLALVNMHFLEEEAGIARGFEVHGMIPPAATAEGATGEIVSSAMAWIEGHRDEPFFVFLHTYDVHSPYRAPEPLLEMFVTEAYDGPADGQPLTLQSYNVRVDGEAWGEREAEHLGALYDAGVRGFDDAIDRFLRFLEESGLAAETLVVLTSDHGEALLEHGYVSHGWTLHGEELRVPLILAGPRVPVGMRLGEAVSLVDIVPTVLSLLDIPVPEQIDGVDLSGAWRGDGLDPNRPLFSEAGEEPLDVPPQKTLQAGRFKLYEDSGLGTYRLFDVVRDPDEEADVAGAHPALMEALRAELERFAEQLSAEPDRVPLTDELARTLEKLGYL